MFWGYSPPITIVHPLACIVVKWEGGRGEGGKGTPATKTHTVGYLPTNVNHQQTNKQTEKLALSDALTYFASPSSMLFLWAAYLSRTAWYSSLDCLNAYNRPPHRWNWIQTTGCISIITEFHSSVFWNIRNTSCRVTKAFLHQTPHNLFTTVPKIAKT